MYGTYATLPRSFTSRFSFELQLEGVSVIRLVRFRRCVIILIVGIEGQEAVKSAIAGVRNSRISSRGQKARRKKRRFDFVTQFLGRVTKFTAGNILTNFATRFRRSGFCNYIGPFGGGHRWRALKRRCAKECV